MSKNIKVKPGKKQSLTGFISGLIFCGIGLFVVVPTFGGFGLIWTLFAVIITIIHGINAFSDKGIPSHEIVIEDNFGYKEPRSNQTIYEKERTTEDRLKELQRLYQDGLITEAEYQKKRTQILKEL